MRVNRKPTGTAVSIPKGLMLGALAAATVTLLGTFLAAWVIEKGFVKWENVGYAVLVILLLSSWTGAVIAVHKVKRQKIMISMASGCIYLCLLFISAAMFFGGQFSGVGETALVILCGSVLGIFTGNSGKQKRNRQKRRGLVR